MNRTFFHPLQPVILAILCACATSTPINTPGPTQAVSVAPAWTAALHVTPTRADCTRAVLTDKTSCYQILLASVLKSQGIDSAMAALTQLAATEPVVRDNSHMFAHSLGLAAFTTPEELAPVFSRCSPGFQSGCYHGVIQAFFLSHQKKSPHTEVTAAEINSLCRDFRAGAGRWLLFQCAHGLGHGLELVYGHDLPRALAGCDLVTDLWERPSCYGGAFMENIVAVTNPHQTAEGMAGGMEMEGMDHDMAGMDMSTGFKKFDLADPHYPCSALPDRYGQQCYLIQTSLMLFENHGDFAKTARTCEAAPEKYRSVCFSSLGRDAVSYAGNNPAAASKSCEKSPEPFRPWCHFGAAKNLVDLTSHPADGFAYCSALSDNVSKVTCYSAVGEEIHLLANDVIKRREMCSAAPAPFDAACLYGARVTENRPTDLVRTP